jgi:hypothetical protein
MAIIKTDDQVAVEIHALTALLPQLPTRARQAVEAAITVLTERLSHDDIFDRFEEGTEEFEDAHAAQMWRDGQTREPALSERYRDLL